MAKNKLAKFAEMKSFSNVIQPPFENVWQQDHPLKGKWNSAFFENSNPIILELGCGKGEYTVNMARLFPDKNYIGIDIKGARMWQGAKQSINQNLKNAGFLRTNIELTNHFFAPCEVSEIWLTFPDPQMKKVNKRLTSTRFINLYREFLIPGGIINLKTDSNFQYQYTQAIIRENGFEILEDIDNIYQPKYQQNQLLSIQTYYEQQWLSRKITIKYLRFRVHDQKLREPKDEPERDPYRSFGRNIVTI